MYFDDDDRYWDDEDYEDLYNPFPFRPYSDWEDEDPEEDDWDDEDDWDYEEELDDLWI